MLRQLDWFPFGLMGVLYLRVAELISANHLHAIPNTFDSPSNRSPSPWGNHRSYIWMLPVRSTEPATDRATELKNIYGILHFTLKSNFIFICRRKSAIKRTHTVVIRLSDGSRPSLEFRSQPIFLSPPIEKQAP